MLAASASVAPLPGPSLGSCPEPEPLGFLEFVLRAFRVDAASKAVLVERKCSTAFCLFGTQRARFVEWGIEAEAVDRLCEAQEALKVRFEYAGAREGGGSSSSAGPSLCTISSSSLSPAGAGASAPLPAEECPASSGGVKRSVDSSAVDVEECAKFSAFEDLGLKDDLLRGIYAYGFERPTLIQLRAILPLLRGRDVIAQAPSGTGKTAAYAIPLLHMLDMALNEPQALVLAPTRELARQIQRVILGLGDFMEVKVHACVGSEANSKDAAALRKGVHVLVGTPVLVFDVITANALRLDKLKLIVLDEADELLCSSIVVHCLKSTEAQLALLSTTVTDETCARAPSKFMRGVVPLLMKNEELARGNVPQFFIAVDKDEHKFPTLCDLYESLVACGCAFVFCNTARQVEQLASDLAASKVAFSAMHGEMGIEEREGILREFSLGRTPVLVATDLLARGIDVEQTGCVVNYDLPTNPEDYLHRIGRVGRCVQKGVAINFSTADDMPRLKEFEAFYGTAIPEMPFDILSHIFE